MDEAVEAPIAAPAPASAAPSKNLIWAWRASVLLPLLVFVIEVAWIAIVVPGSGWDAAGMMFALVGLPLAAPAIGLAVSFKRQRLGAALVLAGGVLLAVYGCALLGLMGPTGMGLVVAWAGGGLLCVGIAGLILVGNRPRAGFAWGLLAISVVLGLAIAVVAGVAWYRVGSDPPPSPPFAEGITVQRGPTSSLNGEWTASGTLAKPPKQAVKAQLDALGQAGWRAEIETDMPGEFITATKGAWNLEMALHPEGTFFLRMWTN